MKATFQHTFMLDPRETVISNMPLEFDPIIDASTGLNTWKFQDTPIMSTYLNAWGIGESRCVLKTCHIRAAVALNSGIGQTASDPDDTAKDSMASLYMKGPGMMKNSCE
jgi:hypothetical protein